jgi:hypothetical protein
MGCCWEESPGVLPLSKLFKLLMLIPTGTLVIGGEINDGFALLLGISSTLNSGRLDNRELMFWAEGMAIFPGATMLATTLVELRSYLLVLSGPPSDSLIGTVARVVVLGAQNVMVLFGTTGEKYTGLLETLKSAGLASRVDVEYQY